jgi:methylated-DNA-[protein]-cysteine S-methyltransferase
LSRLAFESPLGRVSVFEVEGKLAALDWGGKSSGVVTPLLRETKRQLAAYFAGRLEHFDLPLAPDGSPTELRVWQLMIEIPYGRTRSYGELGHDLDLSPRAVGHACGRNPLPILIPCHRVVGMDGGLVGYSGQGGIETKRRLLMLEGALLL